MTLQFKTFLFLKNMSFVKFQREPISFRCLKPIEKSSGRSNPRFQARHARQVNIWGQIMVIFKTTMI